MKKTYISPKTESVVLNCEQLLSTVSGEGVSMKINSTSVKGESADSRGSLGWDDEE